MNEALLTSNRYSRPGRPLEQVRAIVIHWMMNPGETARGARSWWERRKNAENGFGSAHIAIDDRETLLCVPLDEMAYHVGAEEYTEFAKAELGEYPNATTIGIELAHDSWDGRPSLGVWIRTVNICSNLCRRFNVDYSMIVTHVDVTGMLPHWNGLPCHRWFAEQPGEMARLRAAAMVWNRE